MSFINVRERPPLRLDVTVAPPSAGRTYRWGADDKNVQNVPNDLSFSTAMPGGFDQCSLTLERDPRVDYPDLAELSTVTINGLGGSAVAWQGRIEEFPSQAGSEANFTPTIMGWQSALQDNADAAVIYIDRNQSSWSSPSVQRQINLLESPIGISQWSFAAGTDTAGNPAIVFTATAPIDNNQVGEAWYTSAGGLIAAVRGTNLSLITAYWPSTGSALNVYLCSDDVATTSENEGFDSGAPFTFAPATPYGYAMLQVYNNSGTFGTTGDTILVAYENVSVIGNHGLTVQAGESGSIPGIDDGFLASQIIAHAVENFTSNIAFTTGANGTIQPSSFVIPQMVFAPTTALDIIQQATQYELLDYAVWEASQSTTGPTLYVNERGARGNQWTARIGAAQLQNAGPQVSRIFNGVIVQWTDVSGVTYTVGPPGSTADYTSSDLVDSDPQNPANQAGIKRWYLLQLGTSTKAAATQVGLIYLQEQAAANSSGQATLVGHVQDNHGVYWPAWMVRAGDTISFVDASDTSYRRIVSTSYDDTSKSNTIQLDSPPDAMSAILARLQAVIAPLGLQ